MSKASNKKRKPEEQPEPNLFPIFVKKAKHEATAGPSNSTSGSASNTSEVPQISLKEFLPLLDFSSVKTEEEISTRFNRISSALLYDIRLVARKADGKETEFEVLEAEFYLQIEGIHEDPFTHGSEEQKIAGRWYFHRAPRRSEDSHRSLTSTSAYRGGSRKGMDLTIGGPLPKTLSKHFAPTQAEISDGSERTLLRGGILLRSLRRLGAGSKIISGPSLLVDQILSSSDSSSIEDLVQNKWEGNTSAVLSDDDDNSSTRLYLKEGSTSARKSSSKIYLSPRIGLDLSHPGTTGPSVLPLHPRIQFLTKPYRFFVNPDTLVANGRTQTFLGVLHSRIASFDSIESGLLKRSLAAEISKAMGLKESTSDKYLTDYKAGRKAGAVYLDSVIGTKGKGASSSPSTYLKMMGALSTL